MPEVKVGADHDQPRVQAADEHLAHEVLRRLLRTLLVEVDHERVVDSCLFEQLELLVEISQESGRGLGPHDAGGVAVEGHDGGGEVPVRGDASHRGDDLSMATMHTVVRADRHDRALIWPGALVDVAQNLHRLRG